MKLLLVLIALLQTPAPAPPQADALLQQAVELQQAGDLLGAIAAYERALKIEPANPGARSNLGAALVRLGRYDEAIDEYRRAIEGDPSNPSFRFNLALAFYKAARIQEETAGTR